MVTKEEFDAMSLDDLKEAYRDLVKVSTRVLGEKDFKITELQATLKMAHENIAGLTRHNHSIAE